MQRFRGGLVFKAHRLCVSLNSRLESNKEEERRSDAVSETVSQPASRRATMLRHRTQVTLPPSAAQRFGTQQVSHDRNMVMTFPFSRLIDSERGAARAEDAQGTPTQSHISPSILVYDEKEKNVQFVLFSLGSGFPRASRASPQPGIERVSELWRHHSQQPPDSR